MAFQNLEARFREKEKELYGQYSTRTRPDGTIGNTPYLEYKPNAGNRNQTAGDTRLSPIGSVKRDLTRLTKFSLSSEGASFFLQESVLQSGNTFAETQILNPLFVLGNVTPYIRLRRSLSSAASIPATGDASQSVTANQVNSAGRLQLTTKRDIIRLVSGQGSSGISRLLSYLPSSLITNIASIALSINKVGLVGINDRPEIQFTSTTDRGLYSIALHNGFVRKHSAPVNVLDQVGFKLRTADPKGALKAVTTAFNAGLASLKGKANEDTSTKIIPTDFQPYFIGKEYVTIFGGGSGDDKRKIILSTTPTENMSRFVVRPEDGGIASGNGASVSTGIVSILDDQQSTTIDNTRSFIEQEELGRARVMEFQTRRLSFANNIPSKSKIQSQITPGAPPDVIVFPSEFFNATAFTPEQYQTRYTDPINLPNGDSGQTNLITCSMTSISDKTTVHFRAYLTGMAENITPEYATNRYIGRTEKNIIYQGVQRTFNFTLRLHALSRQEMDVIWKKYEFLSSLCFPARYDRGYMVSNFVELTIGKFYDRQPGYLMNISAQIEDTTPWDVRSLSSDSEDQKQLPHGITISIQYAIIEKTQVSSATPQLYGFSQTTPTPTR